jgi:hypothetical protein
MYWHTAYQSTMYSWNIGKLTQHRSNHSNTCLKKNITPKHFTLLSNSLYCKTCFCHFPVKISFITTINTDSYIMIQEKTIFQHPSFHMASFMLCQWHIIRKLENQNTFLNISIHEMGTLCCLQSGYHYLLMQHIWQRK